MSSDYEVVKDNDVYLAAYMQDRLLTGHRRAKDKYNVKLIALLRCVKTFFSIVPFICRHSTTQLPGLLDRSRGMLLAGRTCLWQCTFGAF